MDEKANGPDGWLSKRQIPEGATAIVFYKDGGAYAVTVLPGADRGAEEAAYNLIQPGAKPPPCPNTN